VAAVCPYAGFRPVRSDIGLRPAAFRPGPSLTTPDQGARATNDDIALAVEVLTQRKDFTYAVLHDLLYAHWTHKAVACLEQRDPNQKSAWTAAARRPTTRPAVPACVAAEYAIGGPMDDVSSSRGRLGQGRVRFVDMMPLPYAVPMEPTLTRGPHRAGLFATHLGTDHTYLSDTCTSQVQGARVNSGCWACHSQFRYRRQQSQLAW